MGSKRRVYTPESRREAARRVIDTGPPICHVADELGIGQQLLGRWVNQERRELRLGESTGLTSDERSELERLCKEVLELRLDNEFLGSFPRAVHMPHI